MSPKLKFSCMKNAHFKGKWPPEYTSHLSFEILMICPPKSLCIKSGLAGFFWLRP